MCFVMNSRRSKSKTKWTRIHILLSFIIVSAIGCLFLFSLRSCLCSEAHGNYNEAKPAASQLDWRLAMQTINIENNVMAKSRLETDRRDYVQRTSAHVHIFLFISSIVAHIYRGARNKQTNKHTVHTQTATWMNGLEYFSSRAITMSAACTRKYVSSLCNM